MAHTTNDDDVSEGLREKFLFVDKCLRKVQVVISVSSSLFFSPQTSEIKLTHNFPGIQ
jgi:hypothetical protein